MRQPRPAVAARLDRQAVDEDVMVALFDGGSRRGGQRGRHHDLPFLARRRHPAMAHPQDGVRLRSIVFRVRDVGPPPDRQRTSRRMIGRD